MTTGTDAKAEAERPLALVQLDADGALCACGCDRAWHIADGVCMNVGNHGCRCGAYAGPLTPAKPSRVQRVKALAVRAEEAQIEGRTDDLLGLLTEALRELLSVARALDGVA